MNILGISKSKEAHEEYKKIAKALYLESAVKLKEVIVDIGLFGLLTILEEQCLLECEQEEDQTLNYIAMEIGVTSRKIELLRDVLKVVKRNEVETGKG